MSHQGFIHFAIGIRKDAHPRNLIGEPIDVFWVVCFFNADEDHQATVDFSANFGSMETEASDTL
jgi:hypothetical protein